MLPQDNWIDLNGVKLHYLDWGNPSAQPLVLLRGFCSYAHFWDPFARSMRRDYHVIAPDLRGHGEIAQQMLARLPHGSLAEVARATHNIVGDNPAGFESAVRKFLAAGS